MNIPTEFHELLTAAGYTSPWRVLWFHPVHRCAQCATIIPIWADVCYACNGDTPTCPHATTATPRFTWTALDQKSYTVCLDCFDYITGEDPGTFSGEPLTPPSVADLKTALDVLEALTPFHDLPAPCIDETAQILNALLLATCPHDRLATGPQCLDCGQRLDAPALWFCRDCGEDLRETGRLVEVVIAHTYVTFHDDDTAEIRESEPAYETCQTARVECGDCGQPLDDAHAARFLAAIRDDYRDTTDPAAAAYLQAHGDD